MKNKILTFIIGVLIGAIIATLGWCIYIKNINTNHSQMNQMMNRQDMTTPPDKPQGMEQYNTNLPQEMPTT